MEATLGATVGNIIGDTVIDVDVSTATVVNVDGSTDVEVAVESIDLNITNYIQVGATGGYLDRSKLRNLLQ